MGAIIKRELVAFFKNPIAYFIIAIYALLSAIFFTLFVVWQNTSYLGEYFGFYLFFVDMILVAVLSMRFFSEEKKNKTDQLLLTSPINLYSLVIGKFIGAMIVFIAATSVNLIYVLIIDTFGNLDYGALFSNIAGTLLIGCTLVSLGLFISSLTESQIGAAAGTVGVLIFMFVIDFFAGFLPEFFAKLIANLNIYTRYQDFTNGIISLPPVIYYLSMTVVFLFLTVRSIEKRRWS